MYVTSIKTVANAFEAWIAQSCDPAEQERRQILRNVWSGFIHSTQGQGLINPHSGILCFVEQEFEAALGAWVEAECRRVPNRDARIRYWGQQLRAHMGSSWRCEHKLVLLTG